MKLSGGVLSWVRVRVLEQGADLHMAQLMLLPLTVSCFSKIRIGLCVRSTSDGQLYMHGGVLVSLSVWSEMRVLPFWYRLIRVVPDKRPLNARVCVCVIVCSMFVLLEGRSKDDAFVIGQEIADAVTNDNPKPVKLKLEKVNCFAAAKYR